MFLRGAQRAVASPQPKSLDAGWKVLDLVVGWIKYADAKAGATLAAAGAVGALLIAQSNRKGASGGSFWAIGFACGAGVALVGASLFALIVLAPRLKAGTGQSLLYFDHIATNYQANPEQYVSGLKSIDIDGDALHDELGRQIVANAVVAKKKFYATTWSVRFLLVGTWLSASAWLCANTGG